MASERCLELGLRLASDETDDVAAGGVDCVGRGGWRERGRESGGGATETTQTESADVTQDQDMSLTYQE